MSSPLPPRKGALGRKGKQAVVPSAESKTVARDLLQDFYVKGRASNKEGTTVYSTRVRMSGVQVDCEIIRYEDGEIDVASDGQQIEKIYRHDLKITAGASGALKVRSVLRRGKFPDDGRSEDGTEILCADNWTMRVASNNTGLMLRFSGRPPASACGTVAEPVLQTVDMVADAPHHAEAFSHWMQKIQDTRQAIEQAAFTWAELTGEDRQRAREAEEAEREEKEERARPEKFWRAVKEGKARLTEQLLELKWKRWQPPTPLLKMEDSSGWTPLHWAAFRNHKDVCLALVRGGADLLALDKTRHTALHVACYGGSTESGDLLLEEAKKKKLAEQIRDTVNIFGATPLLDAACNDHSQMAASLIASQCDWRAPRKDKDAGFFRTGSSDIDRRFSASSDEGETVARVLSGGHA